MPFPHAEDLYQDRNYQNDNPAVVPLKALNTQLSHAKPQIILEIGADWNFTSGPLLKDKTVILFFLNSVEVNNLTRRICDPVVVGTVFGALEQVTGQIRFPLNFLGVAKSTIWCYLL